MYIFLTKNANMKDPGEPTKYFAIDPEKIETLRTSQTFTDFGQKVGTYNAGDSIELTTQKAVDLANTIAKEQDENYDFSNGDIINGYDSPDVFDLIEDAFDKSGLKAGEDYDLNAEESKGFDYWDGSNWKTFIVANDYAEPPYSQVEDEELEKELNEAIENMEEVKKVPGGKIYEGGRFQIEVSFWAGDWAEYTLILLDEVPEDHTEEY